MNNYALYYPTIEFVDYQWLWSASLLWDRIYRIVPSGYAPDDPPNVRALTESGEIGIPIHPDDYISELAAEFVQKLEGGEWTAAALIDEMPEEYTRLHAKKVDVALRRMIIARGAGRAKGEWLHVPTDFAAHYMTFLANAVAERNGLQMLSDSAPAWTGATYFRFNGEVEDFPNSERTQQLAALIVRDFIPSNLLEIPPSRILYFRQHYRAERQRFLQAMQKGAQQLSECDDGRVAMDIVHDMTSDIEAALRDYRGSLSALKVSTLTGLKSLTFPLVTKVAASIVGPNLDPSTLSVLTAFGAAMGLVSGLSDYREKRKRLVKECDYSYLLHLGREWTECAMYGKDYNYYLCREMEEFIND